LSVAAAAAVIGEKLAVGKMAAGERVARTGAIGTADASTITGRARGSGVFLADLARGLAPGFLADFAAFDFAAFAGADFAFAAFFSGAGAAAAGFAVALGLAANAGALRTRAIAHPNSPRDKERPKVIPSLLSHRGRPRPHPKNDRAGWRE
jgi:hypothetical protein